jgi:K+ transporter
MNNLPPVKWALRHPRIAAWIVLSVGMVALLLIEARDVGLQTGNWIALIIATILVAGACIWIVSWEDGDESQPSPNIKTKTDEVPMVKIEETDTPASS